jgi:hypothetical protein
MRCGVARRGVMTKLVGLFAAIGGAVVLCLRYRWSFGSIWRTGSKSASSGREGAARPGSGVSSVAADAATVVPEVADQATDEVRQTKTE